MHVHNATGSRHHRAQKPRLSPEVIEMLAARFRALAEPTRLLVMVALRAGEQTVSDLAAETGLSTANVSKHLQILHAAGFVTRRKQGLHVYYNLGGMDVFRLCEILCGHLAAEAEARRKALRG